MTDTLQIDGKKSHIFRIQLLRLPRNVIRLASAFAILALVLPAFTFAKDPVKAKPKADVVSVDPSDANLKWGPCPDIFPKGCEVVVLHGDASKGPSDAYLRTPGNYDLPPHWHTSAEHIISVKGKFSVSYEGGQNAVVAPGAFTYGPARRVHAARCEGAEPCIIYIGFEKPIDAHLPRKK